MTVHIYLYVTELFIMNHGDLLLQDMQILMGISVSAQKIGKNKFQYQHNIFVKRSKYKSTRIVLLVCLDNINQEFDKSRHAHTNIFLTL